MNQITIAEFDTLRNNAISKFAELGYKAVLEDIYKSRKSNLQARLNEAWSCLYVINQYMTGDTDNYLTELEILSIANRLNKIWI